MNSDLLEKFREFCEDLKVYKRISANVYEQILLINTSKSVRDSEGFGEVFIQSLLESVNPHLRHYTYLSSLDSYLRQGDIFTIVNDIYRGLWEYVRLNGDDLLVEEIESLREIYEADKKADIVNIKRLLRDCLRANDFHTSLLDLNHRDVVSLQGALKLELASAPSTDAGVLYHSALTIIDSASRPFISKRNIEDYSDKIVRVSDSPVAWGVASSVWIAELYGKRVVLHVMPNKWTSKEEFYKFVSSSAWAHFDHPQVLPLLGFYGGPNANERMALISPWMANGTITDFVEKNPEVDRLKILLEAALGLEYLHNYDPPYAHGMFSGGSLLINENLECVVGGFASIALDSGFTNPLRWLAPELTKRSQTKPTLAGDVYAFGMTMLEIMTGRAPFQNVKSPLYLLEMLRKGQRPERPSSQLIHYGLDDQLWSLISRCWAQNPADRPSISEVVTELKVFRTVPELGVRDLTNEVRLEGDDPLAVAAAGGFGEIRIGLLSDGTRVAIKTVVVRGQKQPMLRLTKRFRRETLIWDSLKHQNVLPFLGTVDLPGIPTSLVAPWIANGNCIDYLQRNPSADILELAKGIARGLSYLHTHKSPVIHGDLRGANVLISDGNRPLLCDFGLAVIVEDLTNMPISSALHDSGNPRWMAPELLLQGDIVSHKSDVWALGMVLLEMMTLENPYSDIKTYPQVIMAVFQGLTPARPQRTSSGKNIGDDEWTILEACWRKFPSDRPTSTEVLQNLEML